ncbi:hypothetical protein GW17_00056542, partial [Ensete ventricosum]
IQRGRIVLFSKGYRSTLLAPLYVTAAAAPTQVAGLATGGPLAAAPCGRIAGSRPLRPGRGRQPLTDVAPSGLVVGTAGRACGRMLPLRVVAPCGLLPLRGAWPQPAAPLQGGLGCSRPPPCMWSGHALLPFLLIAFAVKT